MARKAKQDDVEVPSDAALHVIATLAAQQRSLEEAVATAEQTASALKAELRKVQEDLLPTAMQEAGLKKFVLTDGTTVSVKDGISITLNDGNKAAVYAWLEANAMGGIIKREVAVSFGRDEQEAAKKACEALRELQFMPEVSMSVNNNTLKATLREAMERGIDVPLDAFNAFTYSKADVKVKKTS